ncbi:hypothetical protein [Paraburkholderia dinghuensis]|uniref:Uncharacterized protein n=1 Tax=Paraburkholderia dinghuensis TaxID=2305225 RepID=A0A3N6MPJ3_9BURK|nr:hypothetical protein [Paraburkholderia dinghuensis]RQH05639.1 hypothetical protein D1Y85_13445 [Paraburkholderia dinghuensis]
MHHRYTGRIGPLSPKHLLFVGVPVIIVLAGLYALFIRYNPFIYFSIVATLLFGVCIGPITESFGKACHSRSVAFDLASALVLGIFALWVSWLIWIALSSENGVDQSMEMVRATPTEWYGFLDWLAHHRYETVSRYFGAGSKSAPTTPTEFALKWSIKAILIVGIALLTSSMSFRDRVYSEKMKRWAVQRLKIEISGIVDTPDKLRIALEHGDFSVLDAAVPYFAPAINANGEERKCYEITLIDDPDDPQLRVIDLMSVEHYTNAKGKNVRLRLSIKYSCQH